MAGKGIAAALLLALVAAAACLQTSTAAGLTCGDAVNALIPCGAYLLGSGPPTPSSQCCQSAQALNRAAGTASSRRSLCECLEKTGPSFGVLPTRARNLPPLCKLKLNIPVSPTADCSKIG